MSNKTSRPFSLPAMDRISGAVVAAERRTSAEIKVIVLKHCWVDIHAKAKELFYKHELHQTQLRNAVMILVVLTNREFLVFGDQGIHEKVDDGFWLDVRDAMLERFRAGELSEGICTGIEQIAIQLEQCFPRDRDDVNEISDEVVHDE